MIRHRTVAIAVLLAVGAWSAAARGQGRPDPAEVIAAQEAMAKLSFMDGV